jgi:DNA-binding HxlR family transcriptional regulator
MPKGDCMSRAEGGSSGFPSFTTGGEVEQQPNRAESIISVQENQPETYFAVVDAIRHETQGKVLEALNLHRGSITKEELEKYLTVTDRTLRKHLTRLDKQSLIVKDTSRTTVVSFKSEDVELLVAHALSCLKGD